jgi:cyclic di-GMP phosphodiesterase
MNSSQQCVVLYEPDESLRVTFVQALQRAGWSCEIAGSLGEALQIKPATRPCVFFLAVGSREDHPTTVLRDICRCWSDAAVIVLAEKVTEKLLLNWMRAGVSDVIRRPVEGRRLSAAAQHWFNDLQQPGEKGDPADGRRSMLSKAVHALIEILEARDRACVRDSKEDADLCVRVGKTLGLSAKSLQALRLGTTLHDVGRVAIRDEVMHKTGTLNPSEQSHMAAHVLFGESIMAHFFSEPEILGVVRHHHEWFNGRGYPDGLRGEEIPLGARILAAVDLYLSLTQRGPHRSRQSEQDALRAMCHRVGTQFCPKVMAALLQTLGYRRPDAAVARGQVAPGADQAEITAGVEDVASPGEVETGAISRETLEKRISRLAELRALPTVVADVLALTSREDVRIEDLAEKIKGDHAVSTKLLSLANSALYGGRMKVESIDRAVLKLGLQRVRQLVLGIGVVDFWRQHQDPGLLAGGAFWQHSMSVALLSRQISVMVDYPDEQNAFTAGLLHDIGQLVLQDALEGNYTTILAEAREERTALHRVEQKHFDTDHGQIMRSLGKAWGLPDSLINVMALHHQGWDQLGDMDENELRLLLCVRLANVLSHAIGCGDAELGGLEMIPPSLLDILRLDPKALDEVLRGTPQQVEVLSQAYGLSPEDINLSQDRSRRPPQRRGFYVAENDDGPDPVQVFLTAQGASVEAAGTARPWARDAELAWCIVRGQTPAFVQGALGLLDEYKGDRKRAAEQLLVLLPRESTDAVQGLLSKANVPFLVEPWSIAALVESLDRIRAVRSPAERQAAAAEMTDV